MNGLKNSQIIGGKRAFLEKITTTKPVFFFFLFLFVVEMAKITSKFLFFWILIIVTNRPCFRIKVKSSFWIF